jgi:hypothetical protein
MLKRFEAPDEVREFTKEAVRRDLAPLPCHGADHYAK